MSKITLFALLLLILLAGCRGGSKSAITDAPDAPNNSASGPVALSLDAVEQDGTWRVTLTATGKDIYQAAGTLLCSEDSYNVLSIEAGGGLGGPRDCYFVGKETEPGKIDFAYTKRFHGSGVNGEAALLSIVVEPHSGFSLGDFTLAAEPELLIRDSAKQAIEFDQEVR